MAGELRRRTPEEYLPEADGETRAGRRGYLKIFLGYVSGAGKSFRMLDEARRRRGRGQDVVVGGIQPRMPADVAALLDGLEVIPLKAVGAGTAIDVETIIRRHPAVCFIDGLAYNNPPGSKNRTRWQDVEDLLGAGIKVIGSVNIQYVEEMREQAETITHKHVNETVPLAFVKSADEIEIVDAPPEELDGRQQRLARLRELTLVLAAEVVDHQLLAYLEQYGIRQLVAARERILVCVTSRANVAEMMETARVIADRFHADLIAAYVNQPEISAADQAVLETKLAVARAAGATIEILEGEDPVAAILDFAHERGVTQLFIGHSQRTGLAPRLWGNPVEKLIRKSRGMDIRIFPQ
jgi:two-component system sensor histidine kinase KdpD